MYSNLTDDAKVILLLCSQLNTNTESSALSDANYAFVVNELIARKMRPGQLLYDYSVVDSFNYPSKSKQKILTSDIIKSRLRDEAGLYASFKNIEKVGIKVVTRSDTFYPQILKKYLKFKAPPIIYCYGNLNLLNGGGLAMVGSRNIDPSSEDFCKKIAACCAKNNINVVTGAARGVDRISMNTALTEGGKTIGVLSDSLYNKCQEQKVQMQNEEGSLLLMSIASPFMHFNAANAMNRNKIIYGMADYSVVVSSDLEQGGTWSGAVEALRLKAMKPVFVRKADNLSGNKALIELGALKWPEGVNENNIYEKLNNAEEQSTQLSIF